MNNDESSSFNGHQYAASNRERKAVFRSGRTPNETLPDGTQPPNRTNEPEREANLASDEDIEVEIERIRTRLEGASSPFGNIALCPSALSRIDPGLLSRSDPLGL